MGKSFNSPENGSLSKLRPREIGAKPARKIVTTEMRNTEKIEAVTEEFTEGWAAAVIWSSTHSEGRFTQMEFAGDVTGLVSYLTPEARRGLNKKAEKFLEVAVSLPDDVWEVVSSNPGQAGHTAALMVGGHGVSFTDDDRTPERERLNKAVSGLRDDDMALFNPSDFTVDVSYFAS